MRFDGLAALVADGVVVHRIHLNRAANVLGHLVFVVFRLLRLADEHVVAARRWGFRQLHPGAARLVGAVAVLGAGNQDEIDLAIQDLQGRAVDDGLVLVAADECADGLGTECADAFT